MKNHELWNEIGNLYTLIGAYRPAIQAFAKASQMNSGWGKPICNLAMIYARTGNIQVAIELLQKGMELLSDPNELSDVLNYLGFLHIQNRSLDKAINAYQQSVQLSSELSKNGVENFFIFDSVFTQNSVISDPPNFSIDEIFASSSPDEISNSDDILGINEKFEQAELKMLDFEYLNFNLDNQDNVREFNSTMPDSCNWSYAETFSSNEQLVNTEDTNLTEIGLSEAKNTVTESEKLEWDANTVGLNQSEETQQSIEILKEELLIPTTNNELRILESEIERCKLQIKNNPYSLYAWEKLSDFHKSAGQYSDAVKAIEKAISLNPEKPANHYRLGLIHAVEHREAEAVYEFRTVLDLDPEHSQAHASLASQYFNMQLEELGEFHINKAFESQFDDYSDYNRACLEAIRGNNNRALDHLQVALESKQTYVNWLLADPDLDSLRNDERFRELLTNYSLSS